MARKRRYGQGSLVPPKRPGGTWGYRLSDGHGGRKQYGKFPSKALAQRAMNVRLGLESYDRAGVIPDAEALPVIDELVPAFFDRWDLTHPSTARSDRGKYKNHLKAFFGRMRPGQVNQGHIRTWVLERRKAGVSGGTIHVCAWIASRLWEELREERKIATNPWHDIPETLAPLMRSDHDPETTPFLHRLEDVRRVYLALDGSIARLYALCALAGMRPGEARALPWTAVDLAGGWIHITKQVSGKLKGRRSRRVPILEPLAPLLREWFVKSGGRGLVAPPERSTHGGEHIYRGSPNRALEPVLRGLGLPGMNWYQATRHTFASLWVLRGWSITVLSKILGHSSVTITEVYAHLRPDLYPQEIRGALGPAWHVSGGSLAAVSGQDGPDSPVQADQPFSDKTAGNVGQSGGR